MEEDSLWAIHAGRVMEDKLEEHDDHRFTFNTFNTRSLLESTTNALGHETTSDFNELGQVIQISGPVGASVAYEYDSRGRVIAEYDPARPGRAPQGVHLRRSGATGNDDRRNWGHVDLRLR